MNSNDHGSRKETAYLLRSPANDEDPDAEEPLDSAWWKAAQQWLLVAYAEEDEIYDEL